MAFVTRQLAHFFAVSALAASTLGAAAHGHSPPPPETRAAPPEPPSTDAIPAEVKEWRDVFSVEGADTGALAAAMDRIFAVPRLMDALKTRVARNRAAAAAIAGRNGAGLTPGFAAQALHGARHKIRIIGTTDEDAETGVLHPDPVIVRAKGGPRALWTRPEIIVLTRPESQYLGRDGLYHDNTLLAALAHELSHVVGGIMNEQANTNATNAWMKAIDPAYAPRGDYFLERMKPESETCRFYSAPDFDETVKIFSRKVKQRGLRPLFRENGRILSGPAAIRRMAREYYALCPKFEGP